jgi:hypothetical protein
MLEGVRLCMEAQRARLLRLGLFLLVLIPLCLDLLEKGAV